MIALTKCRKVFQKPIVCFLLPCKVANIVTKYSKTRVEDLWFDCIESKSRRWELTEQSKRGPLFFAILPSDAATFRV